MRDERRGGRQMGARSRSTAVTVSAKTKVASDMAEYHSVAGGDGGNRTHVQGFAAPVPDPCLPTGATTGAPGTDGTSAELKLIRVGIGVITVAGWIIGAYTYLTGKPPP